MTTLDYEVRYGATPTVLADVQVFTVTRGRKQIQDPFKASVATIEGRNPGSLPTIEIGTAIDIVETNSNNLVYRGYVADFRIDYGITSNLDRWVIDCEDALALAGRAFTSSTFGWSAGQSPYAAALVACAGAGITLTEVLYGGPPVSKLSAQSKPNNNLLNILNDLVFTEQGRLYGSNFIGWTGRAAVGLFPEQVAFTDGTMVTALDPITFDKVTFASKADSYFDRVVIEPEGLAAQDSGTGDRSFTHLSYDETTTQAQNLADYVLATLTVQDAVPTSVSCMSEDQTNATYALGLAIEAGSGVKAGIILRGQGYTVFVEGCTMTATPDQTRWTFDVVSAEAQNFFVLDSSVFGVLDSSRLGF